MRAAPIHCPYCNAQFPSPQVASGARVTCPRCGERFPFRELEPTTAPSEPSETREELQPAREVPNPRAPRLPVSNRVIAWILLGIMTFMASVAGVYAWFTPNIRREHDFHLPRPSVIDIPLIARIA